MPEMGCGEVTIEVENSDWMIPGQEVFVENAGTFQVVSKPDSTHAVLRNLQNCGASSTYFDNTPPGTSIPSGGCVSPAGLQGPEGQIPDNLFNISSPTMQKGDILVDDGANSPSAHLVRHPVGADGETLHADSGTSDGVKWEKVDLADTTQVTGTLPINQGGTGETTKTLAFNALSPLTTRGDILTRDATNNIRIGIGATGTILTSDGTDPSWQANAGGLTVFESSERTIGAGNTTEQFAHGFSDIPPIVRGVFVCKSAELGFVANDELDIAVASRTSGRQSISLFADLTNISMAYDGGNEFFVLRNETTYSPEQITKTKWKLKAYGLGTP